MSVPIPTKLEIQLVQELDRLVAAGLYVSRSEAIRDAVRKLVAERYLSAAQYLTAIASIIAEVIMASFGASVEGIILFGSVAKGTASADSDIDLLILTGGHSKSHLSRLSTQIHELVYPLTLASNTVATMIILSRSEFERMFKQDFHFSKEVVERGIQLRGNAIDDLRS